MLGSNPSADPGAGTQQKPLSINVIENWYKAFRGREQD